MDTQLNNGNGDTSVNGRDSPAAKKTKMVSPKEELIEFDKVFKLLMNECLNEGGKLDKHPEVADAMKHFFVACK